jgi:hypothetical protein
MRTTDQSSSGTVASSMIRTRRAALAQSGYRFSLATNAKRLRGDHAQTKKMERDDDSKKSSRSGDIAHAAFGRRDIRSSKHLRSRLSPSAIPAVSIAPYPRTRAAGGFLSTRQDDIV